MRVKVQINRRRDSLAGAFAYINDSKKSELLLDILG